MFICTAFKSHTEWSFACVSSQTIMKLPTTVSTNHVLNYFGHMIYTLQSSLYQNIAKLLTYPSIYIYIYIHKVCSKGIETEAVFTKVEIKKEMNFLKIVLL